MKMCVLATAETVKQVLKEWSALTTKDTVPSNKNEKYVVHVKTTKSALWKDHSTNDSSGEIRYTDSRRMASRSYSITNVIPFLVSP